MKSVTGLLGGFNFGGISTNPDGIVTTRAAQPPITIMRWARNGRHPNALLQNHMDEAGNQAAMFRGKEVFHAPGIAPFLTTLAHVAGARNRWRFAFHTGPYTRNVMAIAHTEPPSSPDPSGSDGYTQLDLTTGSTTTSTQFHAGYAPTRGWDVAVVGSTIIAVTPDSEYTGLVTDYNYSLAFGVTLYELPSLSELGGGYLVQNLASKSPIYTDYRQNAATLLRNLWRRGGSQVLNWTVDDGTIPATTISSTLFTVLDTPYRLRMTGKARRSQLTTGVPCRLWAYGTNHDPSTPSGEIALVSTTTGATALHIVNGAWNNSETGWKSVDGFIPATEDSYDLKYADNGGGSGFSLYAVSIYEYEP